MDETNIDSILANIKSASELLNKKHNEVSIAQEKLDKERNIVAEETLKNSNQVKLNVGGTYFRTTISTLTACPDSMFSAMFSGRHELAKDEDGCVFIDRDPAHFRLILNWLRDYLKGDSSLPTLTSREREEVMKEAEYYLFSPLVNLLENLPNAKPKPKFEYKVIERLFAKEMHGQIDYVSTETFKKLHEEGYRLQTEKFHTAEIEYQDTRRNYVSLGHTYFDVWEKALLGE